MERLGIKGVRPTVSIFLLFLHFSSASSKMDTSVQNEKLQNGADTASNITDTPGGTVGRYAFHALFNYHV
jgi:hypothetical protein